MGWTLAGVLYFWAALWTALIAAQCPDKPIDKIALALGCIIIGLLWPITLPVHLGDFESKNAPR